MLLQIVTKLFTGEAGIFLGRLQRVAALYAAMAVFALAAFGFLLGALFTWLSERYGPVGTAIGFALFCIAVVLALFVALVAARRPPKVRAGDRLQRDVASIASVAALTNFPLILSSVRRRKGLLLVPVAGVGLWGILRAFRTRRDD